MTRTKYLNEKAFFVFLIIIGLVPLLFTKYYLTLDGPAHIYNGNIIKELILGNHTEFSNLFKLNSLPVPNWISHFLFACCNIIFPDYISEKLVLGSYLILFPLFFRKIVLWFTPQNYILSYLGILFAHNHLLYLGSYNLIFAIAFFFITCFYILKNVTILEFKQIALLAGLFLLVYFSHILILLVTFSIAIILPIAILKNEKSENGFIITNWNLFFIKLKVVFLAMIPALILTVNYLLHVDSLEKAGRLDLNLLIDRFIDIRPMLTLCMCKPWNIFTHILFGVFILMIVTNVFILIKRSVSFDQGNLNLNIPNPRFSLMWFLLFFAFLLLYLIVPNANILPERLIILVYIFMGFWLATQTYPRWLLNLFLVVLVTTHITFAVLHTKHMRVTSRQIEQMHEITEYVEPGSLLLTFNYAHQQNWLHMHSSGYFGSDKPIAVIENYEGQLKWFPVSWNLEGAYELAPINVWAADNRKMINKFYLHSENPDFFTLPRKNGSSQIIPYAVIFGKVTDEKEDNYLKIMSILDKSYSLTFQNDFCKLYKILDN